MLCLSLVWIWPPTQCTKNHVSDSWALNMSVNFTQSKPTVLVLISLHFISFQRRQRTITSLFLRGLKEQTVTSVRYFMTGPARLLKKTLLSRELLMFRLTQTFEYILSLRKKAPLIFSLWSNTSCLGHPFSAWSGWAPCCGWHRIRLWEWEECRPLYLQPLPVAQIWQWESLCALCDC